MPLLLTETDVRRVLPMADLIEAMESALARFSTGAVVQPVRTVLEVGRQKAFFGVMPAYAPEPGALGAKLVTLFDANTERGLPTHLATIVLLDPATGALLSILDGRFITEARTAAVSAVATRHLARPDAGTLAILGTSVQARSHLEALAHVRILREIRIWSPNETHRRRFADEMASRTNAPIRAAADAAEAVRDADLVVLATSSPRPVLESRWVKDGAHVVSVGACRPDQREMDPALIARGRLVVDSRAAALVESGDIVMGIAEGRFGADHIVGELGQVVLGNVAGRPSPETVTIFKSLGLAVEDLVAAHLAYCRARHEHIGVDIEL